MARTPHRGRRGRRPPQSTLELASRRVALAGLVCIELLKLLQPDKKIEDFKNAFCNLALPFISFSEPIAAPKKQA